MRSSPDPGKAGDTGERGSASRRDELAHRYTEVRRTSESLCAPLSAEDAALQSMPDASPAKWHLAHTSWFFETFVLKAADPAQRPFHPAFEALYNSYYQAVGEPYPRPARGLLSRPSLDEVLRYRAHVDARLLAWLARPESERCGELRAVLELGLQHEQQHQELILTDVKHLLSLNPLRPTYCEATAPPPCKAPAQQWTAHPGGLVAIGHGGTGFAFDNESPRHRVWLEPFALATRPATNGEFLAFVADGGYERAELWLSDGWDLSRERGWRAPLYWEADAGGWRCFTLAGLRELAESEPVSHLSYYEADAFARWAGARLPSEAEWEAIAASAASAGGFLESARLHPSPARPAADPDAPLQMSGEVWQWTSSAYAPYPGYRPARGALGEYNGKFMSGRMVLRGASCLTPRSHARASYRNFFPPDARWQMSGVRLARDAR